VRVFLTHCYRPSPPTASRRAPPLPRKAGEEPRVHGCRIKSGMTGSVGIWAGAGVAQAPLPSFTGEKGSKPKAWEVRSFPDSLLQTLTSHRFAAGPSSPAESGRGTACAWMPDQVRHDGLCRHWAGAGVAQAPLPFFTGEEGPKPKAWEVRVFLTHCYRPSPPTANAAGPSSPAESGRGTACAWVPDQVRHDGLGSRALGVQGGCSGRAGAGRAGAKKKPQPFRAGALRCRRGGGGGGRSPRGGVHAERPPRPGVPDLFAKFRILSGRPKNEAPRMRTEALRRQLPSPATISRPHLPHNLNQGFGKVPTRRPAKRRLL
jgi:hypothetical protein